MADDFDPEAYLAEEQELTQPVATASPALEDEPFDPEAYLSENEVVSSSAVPEVSQTESAVRGAVQGASMGYSDELTGALEAGYDKLTGSEASLGDLYREKRDEARASNLAAEQANPKTYLAGEVGGGVATAFVPGLNVAKGASALKAIGSSAMLGGAAGLGMSDSELTGEKTDVKGAVKDTLIGTAAGGAGGAVGVGLGKAAQSIVKPSSSVASKIAVEGQEAAADTASNASKGTNAVKEAADAALEKAGINNSSIAGEVVEHIDDSGVETIMFNKVQNHSDDLANLGSAAKYMKGLEGSRAATAAGIHPKLFKGDKEAFSKFGRELRERGIVKNLDTVDDVLKNATELTESSGAEISNQIAKFDAVMDNLRSARVKPVAGQNNPYLSGLKEATPGNAQNKIIKELDFDYSGVIKDVEDNILSKLKVSDPTSAKQLEQQLVHLKGLRGKDIPLGLLNDLKIAIGDKAYKAAAGSKDTALQKTLKQYERVLNGKIEETLSKFASPEVQSKIVNNLDDASKQLVSDFNYDSFIKAKKDYSFATTAKKFAEKKAAADAVQKNIGGITMGDVVTGSVVGGATGNPMLGAAAAVAKSQGRAKGSSAMASLAGKTANNLDNLGTLLQKSPESFGKYGKILADAAARGKTSLASTYYILSTTRPDFKESEGYKMYTQEIPE